MLHYLSSLFSTDTHVLGVSWTCRHFGVLIFKVHSLKCPAGAYCVWCVWVTSCPRTVQPAVAEGQKSFSSQLCQRCRSHHSLGVGESMWDSTTAFPCWCSGAHLSPSSLGRRSSVVLTQDQFSSRHVLKEWSLTPIVSSHDVHEAELFTSCPVHALCPAE